MAWQAMAGPSLVGWSEPALLQMLVLRVADHMASRQSTACMAYACMLYRQRPVLLLGCRE